MCAQLLSPNEVKNTEQSLDRITPDHVKVELLSSEEFQSRRNNLAQKKIEFSKQLSNPDLIPVDRGRLKTIESTFSDPNLRAEKVYEAQMDKYRDLLGKRTSELDGDEFSRKLRSNRVLSDFPEIRSSMVSDEFMALQPGSRLNSAILGTAGILAAKAIGSILGIDNSKSHRYRKRVDKNIADYGNAALSSVKNQIGYQASPEAQLTIIGRSISLLPESSALEKAAYKDAAELLGISMSDIDSAVDTKLDRITSSEVDRGRMTDQALKASIAVGEISGEASDIYAEKFLIIRELANKIEDQNPELSFKEELCKSEEFRHSVVKSLVQSKVDMLMHKASVPAPETDKTNGADAEIPSSVLVARAKLEYVAESFCQASDSETAIVLGNKIKDRLEKL